MKKLFTILFVIFSLTACKSRNYQPEGLRKLSEAEVIAHAKTRIPFPETVIFKDSTGNIIPKEDVYKLDHDEFYGIHYVNADNEIVEIVIKKDAAYVKAFNQKLSVAFEEAEPIAIIDTDCSNTRDILKTVYEADQGSRQGRSAENFDIDKENQQIVVSIIEKCGFPTVEGHGYKSVETVFLVLQHAGKGLRSKYFPLIKESAGKGDLSWSIVALMEDRMLMDRGEKQKYGSQVRKNNGSDEWFLYPIHDPENVNERRAKIGLEPIEDYLKNFDIEYIEQ